MAYIDTSKVTIPKGFFEDLNVPKLLEWLNNQPAADVVTREEYEKVVINMNAYGLAAKRLQEDAFVQMRAVVEKIEEKLKDKLNKMEHPIAQATMAMVIKDVLIPAIDEVRKDEEQKLKGGDE